MQVAHHIQFPGGKGLGAHDPGRLPDRLAEIEPPRRHGHAVDRGEKGGARPPPHDAVRQQEPQPIVRPRTRERRSRDAPQAVEQRSAVHDDAGRRRIVEDDGEGRGLMRATAARGHQGPRRREHYQRDDRGSQQQQQQMAELQAAGALALRLGQVTQRGEFCVGGLAALEQMQQRRDRRGSEPEQHQRMEEAHASRRNARPKGMSVVTW